MPRLRVAVVALLATLLPRLTTAQCGNVWLPGESYPGVGGSVHAAIWWDADGPGPIPNRLVIAGNFDFAFSVHCHGIAAWDPSTDTWSALANGFGPDTEIYCLAVMPNGDLVAGGRLRQTGLRVDGVARWDGTSWIPLGSGMDSFVTALHALPNGDLLAGGYFSVAGGVLAERVARWNGTSWSQVGTPPPTYFYVMALTSLPNGDIVAGAFSYSTYAHYLLRWDGSAWTTLGPGTFDGTVYAVQLMPNGDLIVAGYFTSAGGVPVVNCARWDGTWHAMPGWTGGTGRALVLLQNGELALGGDQGVATWDGTSWTALGTNLSVQVEALAELPGGGLFAGGLDRYGTPFPHANAARWDGVSWSRFGAGTGIAGAGTAVVALPDSTFVVGGDFTSIGTVAAQHVAHFDGTTWAPLGAGLGGPPAAFATLPNGDLIAGGDFPIAGGQGIARWDGNAWTPLGQSMDGAVRAIVTLPNGDIVAGGRFLNAGGVWSPFVARWDGTQWNPMGSGTNWYVEALAVLPNGDVIAGGDFTVAGGVAAAGIARWNGTSWSALGPGTPRAHALLALPNGDLVIGGSFSSAGGVNAQNVARFDGSSWSPLGAGLFGAVASLARLPNGDLVAGGRFYAVDYHGLARWDGSTWTGMGLNHLGVRDLTQSRAGQLGIVGDFAYVGDVVSASFARLDTTCPATAGPIVTSCVGSAGPVSLTADTLPWVGSTFASTADGFAPNPLAVSLLGLTSPNAPLTWLWPNTPANCDQLASAEAILLHLPQAGRTSYSFTIPNTVAFAGLTLFHQFLQFELTPQGGLGLLSSSNGLRLTVGAF